MVAEKLLEEYLFLQLTFENAARSDIPNIHTFMWSSSHSHSHSRSDSSLSDWEAKANTTSGGVANKIESDRFGRGRRTRHSRRMTILSGICVLCLLVNGASFDTLNARVHGHARKSEHVGSGIKAHSARSLLIAERPWEDRAPAWCKQLVANPRERPRTASVYDCKRGRFGAVCEDGMPRFFSQYNQVCFCFFFF